MDDARSDAIGKRKNRSRLSPGRGREGLRVLCVPTELDYGWMIVSVRPVT